MKKIGDYTIIEKLGSGQFSTIYKCEKQSNPGHYFAIKKLSKSQINIDTLCRNLFKTEVTIMAKLFHPNILHLHHYLVTENSYYLIVDYCNNGDMGSFVASKKFLSEKLAVFFLKQIMNGFRELHRHKIMHRDLKLANIFLNDNKVVIGDFGFAKMGVEQTCTTLGTLYTMAPELIDKKDSWVYTDKVDLWAIGVCFYFMLFGQPPFYTTNLEDFKKQMLSDSGENLKFDDQKNLVSIECKTLQAKLLEPNPDNRISWNEFFNHELFVQHYDMSNDDTNQDFKKNQESLVKSPIQLANLDELDFDKTQPLTTLTSMGSSNRISQDKVSKTYNEMVLAATQIKERYEHEKNIIKLMVSYCDKAVKFAEKKYFQELTDKLINIIVLLSKKIDILRQTNISSIEQKQNQYNIKKFDLFIENEHNQEKLLKLFLSDSFKNSYYKFYTDKFYIKGLAQIGKIEELDNKLLENFYMLLDYYNSKLSCFAEDKLERMTVTQCFIYMLIEKEKEFGYLSTTSVGVFDWKIFSKGLCDAFYKSVLERASNRENRELCSDFSEGQGVGVRTMNIDLSKANKFLN